MEAARLVQQGRVYDLGRVLDENVPAFPGQSFRQSLVTNAHLLNRRRPDAGPAGWGKNNVNWIIDIVYGTSQMGTHLGALNHLQADDRFYNGYNLYVVDGSFFVSSSAVNPALTIIANALRVGDHLIERLR